MKNVGDETYETGSETMWVSILQGPSVQGSAYLCHDNSAMSKYYTYTLRLLYNNT